jgi:hypothetical protein
MSFFAAPRRDDSISVSQEIIPEVFHLQRARPFYFEDSQVVLQASHSITMFPSAL